MNGSKRIRVEATIIKLSNPTKYEAAMSGRLIQIRRAISILADGVQENTRADNTSLMKKASAEKVCERSSVTIPYTINASNPSTVATASIMI